jgi:hypothetical protein
MTYNLFIDDERWPTDATWADWYPHRDNWVVARNWPEVLELLESLGVPSYISFDHDLGPDEITINGYEIAQKIVEGDMDGKWQIPEGFSFYVHSKNVVGARNISGLLDNYLRISRS